MSENNLHVVILAGGSGTRFWPLSREKMPKQFLSIVGERSMVALTIERARDLVPDERIWIVTICSQTDEIVRELLELGLFGKINILEEPVGKNTAAAIGLAAIRILEKSPDGIMAIFPSDHFIGDTPKFLELLRFGIDAANREWLVTLGIQPTHPETGYGYIEKGEALSTGLYRAARFAEKPDLSTAEHYVSSKNFFWNGGIFLWKADRFMTEMKSHLPDHYEKLHQIRKHPDRLTSIYGAMESISIDYGILENSDRVAVIPADIGWSDVGSWTALYNLSVKDRDRNVSTGDVMTVDSHDSLIRAEERLVATIGVENLIIVETEDAVLVCRKDCSQDVRVVAQNLLGDKRPEAIIRRKVLKPWGAYKVLDQGNGYKVKWLDIKPHQRLSLQSHQFRSEHWTVVSGKAIVTVDDKTTEVLSGNAVYIPARSKHRIMNPSDEMLRIIEVQTGTYLGEDDIIRYEDDYGRNE